MPESKNILIIDDDNAFCQCLIAYLENAGYQVSATASAECALEAVQQNPPDIVLLDIVLPGMSGLNALPYFKKQMGLPVILLTGMVEDYTQVVGLNSGADDYIVKPFNLTVLLARIKAILRRTSTNHLRNALAINNLDHPSLLPRV